MSAASDAPAALYLGVTLHERRQPFLHSFRYRIASMLIDLDRLADADRLSRLFSVERFNLYSFFERDHGARDGGSLAAWAQARFAEAGIGEVARTRLLCSPRVLGYVFNPLSIYFGEDREGRLKGVIYQVHNTFGDDHAYVAPAEGGPRERQAADKAFHVSPFFDLGGRYEFTLRAPAERFSLVIRKEREDGSDLLATMSQVRAPLSTPRLLRLFASQPLSTLKTIAAIHWEAVRLMIKGARYHPRPQPPQGASLARLSADEVGRGGREG